MGLLDDLRALVSPIRAIRGNMGIQVHRVYSVRKAWSGGEPGFGTETVTVTEITEAGGNPPNCKWIKPEERAIGGLPAGTVEIGPITPPFPGGGTDAALFSDPTATQGTALYVKIIGDRHPDPGALYIAQEIANGKAFSYLVRATPVALESPDP
jgi:hypothetical protein